MNDDAPRVPTSSSGAAIQAAASRRVIPEAIPRQCVDPAGLKGAPEVPPSLPRICILTETYYPVVGGGERQAAVLAADLRARGFDVVIVTRRSDPLLPEFEVVFDVPVQRIPPVRGGRWARWLMMLSSMPVLVMLRRRYDILFVSGFKSLGVSAVLIGKLLGKVVILKADSNGELSGAFFRSGLQRLNMTTASPLFRLFLTVRNAMLRRADHFVAISAGIEAEIEGAGVESRIVHSITNSVDTDTFHPLTAENKRGLRRRLGLPENDTIVTYTGRLVTYKGLPLLLEVAARLRDEGLAVRFVLIGSGGLDTHNCELQLKQYVAAHHLHQVVHFAGELLNVHDFLQASDLFVLPSEDDAFPLSLVEAMACGLPVVATTVGGIPDIVTSGRDGVLVSPGDFNQLHAALRSLIIDRSRWALLGQSAARTAQVRYSRPAIAQKYVDLFRSAANPSSLS